jgi:benzoate transport
MATPPRLDVAQFIDERKLSAFQIGLFILCGVCLMLDGFDVQAMGYAGPAIKPEWHISDPAFGRLLSAALKGVLVGSLVLSYLADKIGRRPILIGSCFFFSLTTIATARASSLDQLMVIRFIAGIGLGAIMPNSMALVSEYTPKRLRVITMMIVSNGFTIGAALGGILASWMIPHFGWRSIFYFGGALPLAGGLAMLVLLPESLQFLVLRGKSAERITTWLKRIDPSVTLHPAAEYFVPEQPQRGFGFWQLFREGRAVGTILIWLTYFMNLLNLYFLQGWLPTIAKSAGFSTSTAVIDEPGGRSSGSLRPGVVRAQSWIRAGARRQLRDRVPQHCLHRPTRSSSLASFPGDVHRRLWRHWRTGWRECDDRHLLSHRSPLHGAWRGFRDRPHRLHRRPPVGRGSPGTALVDRAVVLRRRVSRVRLRADDDRDALGAEACGGVVQTRC